MPESLIKGGSDTAFMVAAWRAAESARPDALFHDPFAARLAGEHGKAIVADVGAFPGGWQVVIRTLIIDDLIQKAVAAGIDTIVNLGAGLDARPYRMALPDSMHWIEVDHPQVIDWKADKLAGDTPRCRLDRIKLDLIDVAGRRALFADVAASSKKILILTEGVLPYLTTDAVAALADDLKTIRDRDVEVAWIVDYFSPETLRYRKLTALSRQMRAVPFQFEPADWFAFFAQHGWKVAEMRYLADEAVRGGRRMPLPFLVRLLVKIRRLLSRGKNDGLQRYAGYALMEPVQDRNNEQREDAPK
jgi:methyltransferase (TIGR00027 family)